MLSKELGDDEYDFTRFLTMGELLKQIYYGNILILGAEREQDDFYYLLEDLKIYNPKNEKIINRKASFFKNIKNFYSGREMVINAFKIKIIPLADGSYSQYFEGESKEADINWVKKPEKFIELVDYLEDEVKEGFNVNFNQKGDQTRNVREFVDDINSSKINGMESALSRYLKDILPDQEFLNTRNIVKERTIKKGSKKCAKKITSSYIS